MVTKGQDNFILYRLANGTDIKGVMLFDQNGEPLNIGGGGSGGSVSINQGGNPVSETNPFPSGLFIKDFMGNWASVSPFNSVPVRDIGINGAIVNQGSNPNDGSMMLVAGAGFGGARMIPVNLSGQDDTMTLIPVGGVDQDGKQKTFALQGDRAKVNLGNINGEFSELNPLAVENSGIGKKNDNVADSDTGTHSLIAMFKRQLTKLTSLLNVLPASLGQKLKSQSLAVTLPLDQIVPVQTDERPSSYCVAITPSNTVGFGGTSRGIYIGVTGDVSAFIGDSSIVFKNCMAGTILPVQATRIDATNTTATNLIAML